MRTADLASALLDYWTARAEGVPADQLDIRVVQRSSGRHCVASYPKQPGVRILPVVEVLDYSTNWALCGPLVEKYKMDVSTTPVDWTAYDGANALAYGPSAMIAICRAVVRAAFGDEVEDLPCV